MKPHNLRDGSAERFRLIELIHQGGRKIGAVQSFDVGPDVLAMAGLGVDERLGFGRAYWLRLISDLASARLRCAAALFGSICKTRSK
jgi:hypothetical protein